MPLAHLLVAVHYPEKKCLKVNRIGCGSAVSCLKQNSYCIIARFCTSFCSSNTLFCSQNFLKVKLFLFPADE